MSDTDRALASERQRRDTRTHPRGIPIMATDQDEDTSPKDLLSRGATEEDLELARLLGRDLSDPFTILDFAKFSRGDKRRRDEYRSGQEEQNRLLLELLNRPPNEATAALQGEVKDLQRASRTAKWIGGLILTAALGSMTVGLGALWSRAEHDGALNEKIQRLEQDVQQLLRDERRHKDNTP